MTEAALERQLKRVESGYRRGDVRASFREARKLVRAARGRKDDVQLGRALNLLGVLCKELGYHRRGEACYRRALPIFVRVLGRSHPCFATLCHNLGGILYAQGRWGRAERWTRRAIAVRRAALGSDHPAVVADEACLAPILAARGKHREAEILYRRAIRYFSTSRAIRYEVAINESNLGVLLASMGRKRAAEAAYRRALEAYRAMRRAPPHDLALALYNLGALQASAGEPEAAPLLEEARAIFQKTLGPGHSLTRESRRRLAQLQPPAASRPVPRVALKIS